MDLGKQRHAAYYRLPDGRDIKPFFIKNNKRGVDSFWRLITQVKKEHKLKKIVLAYESTSCYWEPIIYQFADKGVRLVQVNPMHTKKLVELGNYLEVVIPRGKEAEIRRFINFRSRCMKDRTAILNQLEKLVHRVFPEFLQIMGNLRTKTAHFLMKHYPLASDVAGLGLEELTLLIRKISRGRLRGDKCEEIFMAAKDSIGIKEGVEGIKIHIQTLFDDLERIEKRIEDIESRLREMVQSLPYSQYLLSIQGIGLISAATMIGEVGDFGDYKKSRSLEKMAGLNLCENSSGNRQGLHHISKRGRGGLRSCLFFCALRVIQFEPTFKLYYENCLKRGMIKIKAVIAVCRKLLRVLFALVRDQAMFVSEF